MKRGRSLSTNPALAAERRARREQRRATEPPRVEDLNRELRRAAREKARAARTPLKRSRLKRSRPEPVELRPPRAEWDVKTRASVCAVCGSRGAVTGHHVVPLRMLKANGVPRELWYDVRNHLPLCDEPSPTRCHKRHETYTKRVPRAVVLAKAPAAIDFADEVGLLHLFDQEYPAA